MRTGRRRTTKQKQTCRDTVTTRRAQSIPVYPADAFCVTNGANLGDAMSFLDELEFDDIYELSPDAARLRLSLHPLDDGSFAVAEDSEAGTPNSILHLDCALTLMSTNGRCTEALILVEVDAGAHVSDVHVLPLSPIEARTEYTLVGADRETARQKFAQVACVSFSRGTRITMSDGRQRPIEDLRVGDRVLTRDDGPQAIRWIGQSTVRAEGDLAPIVIKAGTMNNAYDLVVSPEHRLFVYQRVDQIGAGRADLLVKARHLVNGDSIYVQQGGFVDYFQILFDRHHIIYAEGIAAESMLVDPRTRPALPEELIRRLSEILPQHERGTAHGIDVHKALLDRPDAIELLRRASSR